MSGERGSVSIATAGAAAVALAFALLTADLARVLTASARASTAADAAALAAAQELAMPSGVEPEAVAGDYAAINGASLVSCECASGSFEAVVAVRIPVGPLLLIPGQRSIVAEARAVVDLPSG